MIWEGILMNWFTNLKTRSKVLGGFLIIVMLMGIVGCVGILNLQKISKLDNDLYENNTKSISFMSIIQVNLQKNKVLGRNILIQNDTNKNNDSKNMVLENDRHIDEAMEGFKLTIKDSDINEYNNLKANMDKYRPVRDKVIDLALQNKDDEAISIMNGDASTISNNIDDSASKLIGLKEEQGKAKADLNSKAASTAIITMLVVIIIGIIIAIMLGAIISGLISKPINRILYMLQEMSKGHLGERVDIKTTDEVGQMAKVMDSFAESLQTEVIGTMNKIASGDMSVNIDVKDENG